MRQCREIGEVERKIFGVERECETGERGVGGSKDMLQGRWLDSRLEHKSSEVTNCVERNAFAVGVERKFVANERFESGELSEYREERAEVQLLNVCELEALQTTLIVDDILNDCFFHRS